MPYPTEEGCPFLPTGKPDQFGHRSTDGGVITVDTVKQWLGYRVQGSGKDEHPTSKAQHSTLFEVGC